MMTFQEATSLFFSYLENNRGYSSLTIKNYRSDLAQFELFLNDQSLSFDELTRQDVRNYLFFLKKQNLQPSSVQRKLSCMRHFYHYLVSVHNFESNPFEGVKGPQKSRRLPEFFTLEEVISLLEGNEKRSDPLAKRDQAILELLFASGLRARELCSLHFSQIDFARQTILIQGKGRKERVVSFNDKAKEALLSYQKENRVFLLSGKEDDGTVFLSARGKPLSERGLEYIVQEASLKASFPLKVHPHMFRHSFATVLINDGCDLRVVQELLGHKSISTTAIYNDISFQQLQETYERCFPKLFSKEDEHD
ncbi:MAG: site-specific tyrosine recombinase/integron integrase [Candidatus Enterosoma sp.]|nr:tyrosine-type recombinase/integrase [Bacilli bacterium]